MEWKEPGLWVQADFRALPPLGQVCLRLQKIHSAFLSLVCREWSSEAGALCLRPAACIVRHTGVTWGEPGLSPHLVPFDFFISCKEPELETLAGNHEGPEISWAFMRKFVPLCPSKVLSTRPASCSFLNGHSFSTACSWLIPPPQ